MNWHDRVFDFDTVEEKKELTTRELAKKLGTNHVRIVRILNGDGEIKLREIRPLLRAVKGKTGNFDTEQKADIFNKIKWEVQYHCSDMLPFMEEVISEQNKALARGIDRIKAEEGLQKQKLITFILTVTTIALSVLASILTLLLFKS